MATWKKYFKTSNIPGSVSPISGNSGTQATPAFSKFGSNLPEVYIGHPNRIERYNQYEQMDMDSEVNAALDILAEFCTQKNLDNHTSFNIRIVCIKTYFNIVVYNSLRNNSNWIYF